MATLSDLPPDVVRYLTSMNITDLSIGGILKLCQVSKHLNDILCKNEDLWKKFFSTYLSQHTDRLPYTYINNKKILNIPKIQQELVKYLEPESKVTVRLRSGWRRDLHEELARAGYEVAFAKLLPKLEKYQIFYAFKEAMRGGHLDILEMILSAYPQLDLPDVLQGDFVIYHNEEEILRFLWDHLSSEERGQFREKFTGKAIHADDPKLYNLITEGIFNLDDAKKIVQWHKVNILNSLQDHMDEIVQIPGILPLAFDLYVMDVPLKLLDSGYEFPQEDIDEAFGKFMEKAMDRHRIYDKEYQDVYKLLLPHVSDKKKTDVLSKVKDKRIFKELAPEDLSDDQYLGIIRAMAASKEPMSVEILTEINRRMTNMVLHYNDLDWLSMIPENIREVLPAVMDDEQIVVLLQLIAGGRFSDIKEYFIENPVEVQLTILLYALLEQLDNLDEIVEAIDDPAAKRVLALPTDKRWKYIMPFLPETSKNGLWKYACMQADSELIDLLVPFIEDSVRKEGYELLKSSDSPNKEAAMTELEPYVLDE